MNRFKVLCFCGGVLSHGTAREKEDKSDEKACRPGKKGYDQTTKKIKCAVGGGNYVNSPAFTRVGDLQQWGKFGLLVRKRHKLH